MYTREEMNEINERIYHEDYGRSGCLPISKWFGRGVLIILIMMIVADALARWFESVMEAIGW